MAGSVRAWGVERELHASVLQNSTQCYTIRFYGYSGCLQRYTHHQNINIIFWSGWFSAIGTWNQVLEIICKMGIYMGLNSVSKVMLHIWNFSHSMSVIQISGLGVSCAGISSCGSAKADQQLKATSLIFWKSLSLFTNVLYLSGPWRMEIVQYKLCWDHSFATLEGKNKA